MEGEEPSEPKRLLSLQGPWLLLPFDLSLSIKPTLSHAQCHLLLSSNSVLKDYKPNKIKKETPNTGWQQNADRQCQG